ncbi:MAG TPA: hypothetical protein PLE88_11960 [Anaerohalosphaeraceae bacterium]|nr:hypothetical protein [Anaerohalosphaeraceae bacterium]
MVDQQPLCRNIDTDRIYRVNTGTNKLLRCLSPEFNTINLGCFLPQLPIWTEGSTYAVGDIVFGRVEFGTPVVAYICGIFECRVAHTATTGNAPSASSGFGTCQVQTTLHWRALGTTTLLEYPVCGSLASGGAEPYGGINKSPTGVLVELSGITPKPDHLDYPEIAWHHDYNGVYCLPAMYGYTGGTWYIGGLCDGDLKWTLEFDPTLPWGDCETGTRKMSIRQLKRTLTDNWWTWTYLFCGSHEVSLCETSYTDSNLFLPPPYYPYYWWDTDPLIVAYRQSLIPARDCTGYDNYGAIPPFSGWGGTVSFLGFTDYMTVGFDDFNVEYFNDGESANVRWRFALFGSGGKRVILKNNIVCDFFRLDFQGSDWDIFLGCTTTPVTPDEDGWFETTVSLPDNMTISDFGVTNVNAYNWKYRCHLSSDPAPGTSYLGSLRQSS